MARTSEYFGDGDIDFFDMSVGGRLNSFVTQLHMRWRSDRQGLTRVEEMQIEIIEELLVNAVVIQGFDEAVNNSQIQAQIYRWAWTRTFADRLEEMVRRFGGSPGTTPESIKADLEVAWEAIEKLIAKAQAQP